MKQFLIPVLLLMTLTVFAQRGTIRGSVFDDETGESLVGVSILIKGTLRGTTTDLDGEFSIEIEEGVYDLQISYISYQTILIEKISVKAGAVNLYNNLRLKESTLELQGVVISAQIVRTTEAALNTLKRKSAVMMDGISAANIKLMGDGTAVEAAKRVTGVSIENGKYVYVRGLGDRYSKTTLNNIEIPGLDPDRNSLQMDIFPSNLIDNLIVRKNFTADLPADFTGGLLNIETKDFPDAKFLNISFGVSYNPEMHFNPDYLTYGGGATDFLGFDDGTRALPAGADGNNIPTPISGATQKETVDFIQSFNRELGATRQLSPLDFSIGLSLGNQISLKKGDDKINSSPKLGYIFSLSYKAEYDYYDNVINAEYQRSIDPDIMEMQDATIQGGEMGEHNVLVGVLGGLAYKSNLNKIRLSALWLQNGESRAAKFLIENNPAAIGQSGYTAGSDNLEYNQRALRNILLSGTHLSKDKSWEFDWRVSPTLSTSQDPDIRKTAFTYTSNDTTFSAGAGGNPARIWRTLSELNVSGKLDVTKDYKIQGNDAKLKFGLSHTYKLRDYEILFFDIQFFGSQSWSSSDVNDVLDPINLYPNRPNGIYYQSGNSDPNPNAYSSNIQNTGLYVSNEFSPLQNLKAIIGVRAENFIQRHTGRDQRYASGDTKNGLNLDNDKVLESLDLFPSLNFIYALTEKQNLRASYTQTIARPSFKELSFAQILDPITNRIFNGSLFPYSDWDGHLTETHIDNLDLRWELFLEQAQIFSVSTFYKKFDKPIELVRIPEQQTSTEYQPRNVGNGSLYGLEVEFRKNLDFVSPKYSKVAINANLTLAESSIDMTEAEFNSRSNFSKTGETIKDTRQMAGQSPYVLNAGITYNHQEKGFDAGLFYNVKGPTLMIVGAGLFPDIYFKPFHSLNFSANKKFGEEGKISADLKVSNILGAKMESVYQSFGAEDRFYSSLNPGRSFSIGMSYHF